MKKSLTLIAAGAFLLGISLVSCKKNTPAPENPPANVANFYTASLSGFGEHGGTPSGNAYTLPANIQLIGSMTGGIPGKSGGIFKLSKNIENIPTSLPKSVYTEYGYGTYVNIYMTLFNTNYSSYKLIIPAGVVMCDSVPNDSLPTDTSQGGIIIQDDTINFPPRDTERICLKSFCVNAHHSVPTAQKIYNFKVITNNESLHKMVTILRTKKSLINHIGEIQGLLWNITDYGLGLTQADLDMMNSWD